MEQELLDSLARIAEMTDEELAELRTRLEGDFEDIFGREGRTPEDVQVMGEIADALDNVRTEQTERETAAAERDAQADELARRVRGEDADAEGDAEGDDAAGDGDDAAAGDAEGDDAAADDTGDADGDTGDADGDAGATGDADAGTDADAPTAADDAPPTGDAAPVPVAASARTRTPAARAAATGRRAPLATMTDRRPGRSAPAPRPDTDTTVRAEILAQRHFTRRNKPSVTAGDPITSFDDLVDGTCAAIRSLGRGSGEPILVASAEVNYPTERDLRGLTPDAVTERMDAVISPEALTAAGGICLPLNVDYGIDVMADDSEPVADALPSFQATRGGLRYIQPPTLASVGSAGTVRWTAANDADPGTDGPATKPFQEFDCGTEVEVVVDAWPTRFRFNNLMARFSPEIVAANTKLALANAARVREVYRLGHLLTMSTEVTSAKLLGAARDILATLDQAAAAYRYRQRLPRTTRLRAIFPEFTIDMFRADLTRELAHDRDGTDNLALSDQDVINLLRSRGIEPTFTMDAVPARGGVGNLTFSAQGFGAQADNGALVAWPAEIVWFLFAEGTFQRLDGGRMDFGVVRDSALNDLNQYETMIETFEAIAKRGVEALAISSTVRPNGGSAGTVDTTTY